MLRMNFQDGCWLRQSSSGSCPKTTTTTGVKRRAAARLRASRRQTTRRRSCPLAGSASGPRSTAAPTTTIRSAVSLRGLTRSGPRRTQRLERAWQQWWVASAGQYPLLKWRRQRGQHTRGSRLGPKTDAEDRSLQPAARPPTPIVSVSASGVPSSSTVRCSGALDTPGRCWTWRRAPSLRTGIVAAPYLGM